MKYLKQFNEAHFNTVSAPDDLLDILRMCEDEGLHVDCTQYHDKKYLSVRIKFTNIGGDITHFKPEFEQYKNNQESCELAQSILDRVKALPSIVTFTWNSSISYDSGIYPERKEPLEYYKLQMKHKQLLIDKYDMTDEQATRAQQWFYDNIYFTIWLE